jgi:surfeit locus 1 family protein
VTRPAHDGGAPRALSPPALIGISLAALAAFSLLIGLGTWQLERRAWKLNLIRQIEQRVGAAPIPAPTPSQWPAIASDAAYRRVRVRGTLAADKITLVKAVTDLGPGDWVMAPLRSDRGFTVLVNLGFTPSEDAAGGYRAVLGQHGLLTIVGLVRLTEPHGGFLRANDPSAGRWYSRDVAAIASARGIADPAPYFIDADAAANRPGWPVGGLTVIRFPNSHLVYAIIWFGLAVMVAAGFASFAREQWRASRGDARTCAAPTRTSPP